jgi:hypothetical protein
VLDLCNAVTGARVATGQEDVMTTNHFVVSQRESVWQFSFRGDVTGPFTSKDGAIAAAIAAARLVDAQDVEVVVRDADMRNETIWRTGQKELTDRESEILAVETERGRDA